MELINLADIVRLIWKNRKLIISIALIAAIIAGIASFLITPYYKSSTTIYPGKLSQAPINETALRRGNMMDFGSTEEAEQTIEILSSTNLQERIIEKFHLYDHYQIKKNEPLSRTLVLKEFQGNIAFKRTKFNSIVITVLDKDPQIAANIANAIPVELDSVKYEMINTRASDLVKNLLTQKEIQLQKIDIIKKSMNQFKAEGVMSQFERGYLLQAYAESNPSERSRMKSIIDLNISKGEDFDRTERELDYELDNLYLLEKYITQAKADVEVRFVQKFIVDSAIPAEKKSSPTKWLIVVVAMISSVLL
ncbi:MAG: Wzz/FepE/Etk N-terminal domain-containing protein, partial [Saprospiraceae bacterium]